MKLLITSDWHGDWFTAGVSRYSEIEDSAMETCEAAVKHNVDAFVFSGDLANPDEGGHTLRAIALMARVVSHLSEQKKRCILIAGNHDVSHDGTGMTSLSPLKWIEDVFVVETPTVIYVKPREALLALPYPSSSKVTPEDLSELVTKIYPRDAEKVAVVGHLTVPGAEVGDETTDMARGRDVTFPLAATAMAHARINGHYHKRQVTPEGIIIPGSLARLNFGTEERNEPSYLIVEV